MPVNTLIAAFAAKVKMNLGAIGTGATVSSAITGFAATAVPVLQAFSLVVSIVVGVLTAIWGVKKLRKEK